MVWWSLSLHLITISIMITSFISVILMVLLVFIFPFYLVTISALDLHTLHFFIVLSWSPPYSASAPRPSCPALPYPTLYIVCCTLRLCSDNWQWRGFDRPILRVHYLSRGSTDGHIEREDRGTLQHAQWNRWEVMYVEEKKRRLLGKRREEKIRVGKGI